MRTVLITGGLGYLGGRITSHLATQYNCIVSGRNRTEIPESLISKNVTQVLHESLLQPDSFPSNIDTVVHLAAMNEIDCLKFPEEAIDVNIKQTNIILENAIQKGVKHFIYFSTAHVYSAPLHGNIDELILTTPVHPYAITHKAAEDYVIAAHEQKKIKSIVFRLSNAFGSPLTPTVNRWTLLVSDLCKQAIEKERLELQSNGCQWRNFIGISDVVNAVMFALDNSNQLNDVVYNLGSNDNIRVIDMVEKIKTTYQQLYNKELPVHFMKNAAPTNEPELHFSINRLLSTGFASTSNIEDELKELLIFCNTHFAKATAQ